MNAPTLAKLKVKLFTDGADKAPDRRNGASSRGSRASPPIRRCSRRPASRDYEAYGRDLVAAVPDRHISFEVFSDDIAEMVAQARVIATWGKNVYVKLPVTNTRGEPLFDAVRTLSREGVKINMTAIFAARAGRPGGRCARWRRAGLRLGVCRPARRFRHRLSADHAGRDRARAQDAECRDHLGVDPRGVQRRRGRRHGLPHHHGAGRRAEEAPGDRHARAAASCRSPRLRRSAMMPLRRGYGSPFRHRELRNKLPSDRMTTRACGGAKSAASLNRVRVHVAMCCVGPLTR